MFVADSSALVRGRACGAALAILLPLLSHPLKADVSLASIFSDNAVLQRDREIPVWGAADDGEEIAVKLGDNTAKTVAAGGKWMVRLPAMPAGGPYTLSVAGKNGVALNNLLIGDVWICSGQSNMQWPLEKSFEPETVISGAADDSLRLVTIPRVAHDEPQSSFRTDDAKWLVAGPASVKDFSAVAYFFGKHLRESLGVPIGLISANYGGTPAEAWTSREKLESLPETKSILAQHAVAVAAHPEALAKYEKDLEAWKAEAEKLKAEGKQPPQPPRAPVDPSANPQRPTGLFNAMINPLVPYAIRGAIWYQGESNASRAYQYADLFPAMIEDWRDRWGQGDLPFLFVQLAPFMNIKKEPSDSAWAELREAQRLAVGRLRNVAMAVITDVGEEKDIHPKRKKEVADRLAIAARKLAHGEDVVHTGPTLRSIEIQGDKAVLRFDNLGGGLVARDGPLTGFTVCGEDRKFQNAAAEIVGDAVVVSAPEVPRPVAVRFGWADFPVVNLWNKAGLPASPFRTDNFPWITAGAQ